jgi:hypothetical protein
MKHIPMRGVRIANANRISAVEALHRRVIFGRVDCAMMLS